MCLMKAIVWSVRQELHGLQLATGELRASASESLLVQELVPQSRLVQGLAQGAKNLHSHLASQHTATSIGTSLPFGISLVSPISFDEDALDADDDEQPESVASLIHVSLNGRAGAIRNLIEYLDPIRPHPVTLEPEPGAWIPPQTTTLHQAAQAKFMTETFKDRSTPSIPIRSRDLEPAPDPMDTSSDNDEEVLQTPARLTRKSISSLNSQFDQIVNVFNTNPVELHFGKIDVAGQDLRQPPPKLNYSNGQNRRYLNHYQWIREQLIYVNGLSVDDNDPVISGEKNGLKRRMMIEIDDLDAILTQQWTRALLNAINDQNSTGPRPPVTIPVRVEHLQPFVLVALLLVTLLETLGGVS
ncbi:hypothetical protein BDN72DRAFT_906496 [Pluteus cervinus]|uniref:Uncharacterized protein n=1 Tax=Pluteus cervinus TaxID=181527 RepID=A0ACD2ZZ71_9AGAR|nr:hypothetical protein BDN72DRAFT_906496 [Pluteus cervinus]